MDGFSTLTQKGQVAIPKAIRDYFSLRASDKIHFSIEGDKIVAVPVTSIKNMRGFIKAKKTLSKKEMKQIIKKGFLNKHVHNA